MDKFLRVKNRQKVENIRTVDVSALAYVHSKCFKDSWNEQTFSKLLSNKVCDGFIITNESGINDISSREVISFVLYSLIVDEAEVITICTLPEFQKQGLGSILIKHLVEYAEDNEVEKIFLDVSEANTEAIGLYRKHNFQQISIRSNYYQDHENAHVLCFYIHRV